MEEEFDIGDTVRILPVGLYESYLALQKFKGKKTFILDKTFSSAHQCMFYDIKECGAGWAKKRFVGIRMVLTEKRKF